MVFKNEPAVVEAFHSKQRVEGLTHNFYRYPARSNPELVRRIILECSDVGDVVLDPFMGGGTTVVEALAAGRRAVGIDINGLAHFVTRVKTTPLSRRDLSEIDAWATEVKLAISRQISDAAVSPTTVPNMPIEVQPFFVSALGLANQLRFPRQRRFARCALLHVGRWALDCKSHLPRPEELCNELGKQLEEMAQGLDDLVAASRQAGMKKYAITGARHLLTCSAGDPGLTQLLKELDVRPRIVLTSPPYPGVHVLYHRWQVLGRRETPAPYWIADLRDGHGASHYTMGSRSALGLQRYFGTLYQVFCNLRAVLSPDSLVIQLVAFSDSDVQLPLYRDAIENAGFAEVRQGDSLPSGQVRLVPNRRWYTHLRQDNDASREVMLVHRPLPSADAGESLFSARRDGGW